MSRVKDDEQQRVRLLLTLYEMVDGNLLQGVTDTELAERLSLDEETFQRHALYLKEEGLIRFITFSSISLEHFGRKEAERLMEESYSQKKRRVLEAIADMSRISRIVLYPALAERLGITDNELAIICNGLDEEGLITFPGGDFVEMKAAGYEALEPQPKPSDSTVNVMNIGTNYGAAAVGSHISQTININPEFDNAIEGLLQLIQSSALDEHDKRDLSEEIAKVQILATRQPTPGIVEKVKARIETIKVGLETAKLLSPALPYVEAIWTYFKSKYGL